MLTNHQILPDLVKQNGEYSPLDILDFNLQFSGRRMLPNTVRFQGSLKVDVGDKVDIKFDHMVGAHGLVDMITTSFSSVGQIESISNYPRYIAMSSNATQSVNDMMNSKNSVELKSPDAQFSQMILTGYRPKPANNVTEVASRVGEKILPDFSIMPKFCLNRIVAVTGGDDSVPFTKTGNIRISIELTRALEFLYGFDVISSTDYRVVDPRITFLSIPDDGSPAQPLQVSVEYTLKQSILSDDVVISTRVPALANGCSVSFQEQSHEGTGAYNNVELESLPNLREVQFLFNNNTNSLITYLLRDPVEIVDKYLESLKSSNGAHSNSSLQLAKGGKGSSNGVGLDFQEFIQLNNQSFQIQMKTGVQSGNGYSAYLYFHGLIEF